MSFRARKAGDQGGNERKLEKKYDEEERAGTPQRIMEWINQVVGSEHPPCTSSRFRDFHNYLKDGVVICKLINKLLEHDGKPIVSFKKKASQRFVASANMEQFNQAANYYGVKDTSLFQTADLWEGSKGQFLHVINCLNALGFIANKKEFSPQYETIVPLLAEDHVRQNESQALYRKNKGGDSAAVERKMEKRYDEEEQQGTPVRLINWINQALHGLHPPCPDASFDTLHKHLRNGVVLCKLINKLLEADNKPSAVMYRAASSRWIAQSNMEQFNEAAHFYGVPDTSLFQTADLWEGNKGPFLNVVNSLNTLAFVANSKDFTPKYETVMQFLPE